jgi:hypothetical protein
MINNGFSHVSYKKMTLSKTPDVEIPVAPVLSK